MSSNLPCDECVIVNGDLKMGRALFSFFLTVSIGILFSTAVTGFEIFYAAQCIINETLSQYLGSFISLYLYKRCCQMGSMDEGVSAFGLLVEILGFKSWQAWCLN